MKTSQMFRMTKMASSALVILAVMVSMVDIRVAEGQEAQSCAANLAPCANYLNSTNPPPSCCDPLREAVTNQLDCLCKLYEDPTLLPSLGINVTQALILPKYCNISGDTSACNKAEAPSSSSVPPPGVPGGNNGVGRTALTGISSLFLLSALMLLW